MPREIKKIILLFYVVICNEAGRKNEQLHKNM